MSISAPATLQRLRSRFRYDATVARYRDLRSGEFVSDVTLKRELQSIIRRAMREVDVLSAQLSGGEITLAEWQREMIPVLKNLQISSYTAGRGGFKSMGRSDWGRTGGRLRFQFDRLNRFGIDVEAGRTRGGGIKARAKMYAGAMNSAFEQGRRYAAIAAGFDQERRILAAAEHCPDCVDAAARGWSAINSLPDIGESRCLTNCRCRFQFRKWEEAA